MRSERGKAALRCAIYTRVSTEHGLEQEFNSLDNQREASEAYVKSQSHEGWKLIRTHYDDGGYSGGSMDRPGLQRLLDDVRARRIDIIVVYKVDRLNDARRSRQSATRLRRTAAERSTAWPTLARRPRQADPQRRRAGAGNADVGVQCRRTEGRPGTGGGAHKPSLRDDQPPPGRRRGGPHAASRCRGSDTVHDTGRGSAGSGFAGP